MVRAHAPSLCTYISTRTHVFGITDDINPGFEKLCKIEADLSGMKGSLIRTQGADGPYDILEYKIAIQLGGTELCACIEWVEDVSWMRVLSLIFAVDA